MTSVLRVATACLIVAALAAPAAAESPPQGNGCGGVVVSRPDGGWEGVLVGGPVSAPGSIVEITCEIVDRETGVVVASASSGPRQDVAYAAAPAAYPDADLGHLWCETVTIDGEPWRSGLDGTWTPGDRSCTNGLDPDGLVDQCQSLGCGPNEWLLLLDPALCPLLTTLSDVPGVVETRPDGDLYVAGQWVWDCPPYGSEL